MEPEKHVDGLTGQEFASEAEYLAHTNPITGFTPTDIEHHGERGILVAKKALERTGSLTPAAEAQLNSKMNEVARTKVEENLAEMRAGRHPAVTKG